MSAEGRRIARLEEQAAALLGVFARAGYDRIDPPVLQPAAIFLDRSGEEIRKETFLLTDPLGRELCLRPELTIPVCRLHLARNGGFPARISCHGPVFRMRSSDAKDSGVPAEVLTKAGQFLQTGMEYLGADDRAEADAEVLTLAVEAVRAAGLGGFSVHIGDASLFPGLFDVLPVPGAWRGRLKRHFRRPEAFAHLMQRLTKGEAPAGTGYLAHLGSADEEEARNALSGLLDLMAGTAGRDAFAGRTREEIIERLMEQAAEAASLKLDRKALSVIEEALAISGPAERSLAGLAALLKRHDVALDGPLGVMAARVDILHRLGLPDEAVQFAPRFGRDLDYYTGFVFEIWARAGDGALQIAGGGRYDNLLRTLGAGRDIAAVGCAIRDEALLAAHDFAKGEVAWARR